MMKHLRLVLITALLTTGAVALGAVADVQAQGGPPWGQGQGQGKGQGAGRRGPGYANCPNYQSNQTCYQQGPRRNQTGPWCPRGGAGQTPGTPQSQTTPAPQSGN